MRIERHPLPFQQESLYVGSLTAAGPETDLAPGIDDSLPGDALVGKGAQGISHQPGSSRQTGQLRNLAVSRHPPPRDEGYNLVNVTICGRGRRHACQL